MKQINFKNIRENDLVEIDDGKNYIHWIVYVESKHLNRPSFINNQTIKGKAVYLGTKSDQYYKGQIIEHNEICNEKTYLHKRNATAKDFDGHALAFGVI